METSMQSKEDNELWTAYVDDLWSTALPHLRDEGLYVVYVLYVRMYFMYVCMCVHVCTYVCIYVCTYVCTYVRTYVCIYVHRLHE